MKTNKHIIESELITNQELRKVSEITIESSKRRMADEIRGINFEAEMAQKPPRFYKIKQFFSKLINVCS